ncbi:MAG: hypothetical protein COB66_09050 [Coxiella sp. (in: Bacteria)]|nr:MAG: hypothetical protein COB66_09050 [Coxiella sp. (in: g-proteobacteria)]
MIQKILVIHIIPESEHYNEVKLENLVRESLIGTGIGVNYANPLSKTLTEIPVSLQADPDQYGYSLMIHHINNDVLHSSANDCIAIIGRNVEDVINVRKSYPRRGYEANIPTIISDTDIDDEFKKRLRQVICDHVVSPLQLSPVNKHPKPQVAVITTTDADDKALINKFKQDVADERHGDANTFNLEICLPRQKQAPTGGVLMHLITDKDSNLTSLKQSMKQILGRDDFKMNLSNERICIILSGPKAKTAAEWINNEFGNLPLAFDITAEGEFSSLDKSLGALSAPTKTQTNDQPQLFTAPPKVIMGSDIKKYIDKKLGNNEGSYQYLVKYGLDPLEELNISGGMPTATSMLDYLTWSIKDNILEGSAHTGLNPIQYLIGLEGFKEWNDITKEFNKITVNHMGGDKCELWLPDGVLLGDGDESNKKPKKSIKSHLKLNDGHGLNRIQGKYALIWVANYIENTLIGSSLPLKAEDMSKIACFKKSTLNRNAYTCFFPEPALNPDLDPDLAPAPNNCMIC